MPDDGSLPPEGVGSRRGDDGNEARFRAANERIREAILRLEPDGASFPFVCECSRSDCVETMRLTPEQYRLAREDPRFYVCLPGHETNSDDPGRVVRRFDSFVIVEKPSDT